MGWNPYSEGMAENRVEHRSSEAFEDGEDAASETYTPKVREILLAQPLNSLQPLSFTVLPRFAAKSE